MYNRLFTEKVQAAKSNSNAPATTYSVFHTMADIASISSSYVEPRASLLYGDYDYAAPRYYLDDHNKAVPLDHNIGINSAQRELFRRAGIILEE
jgi:lipid A ethanolaminephosphotransferase